MLKVPYYVERTLKEMVKNRKKWWKCHWNKSVFTQKNWIYTEKRDKML